LEPPKRIARHVCRHFVTAVELTERDVVSGGAQLGHNGAARALEVEDWVAGTVGEEESRTAVRGNHAVHAG
jgi:hypothetical protein